MREHILIKLIRITRYQIHMKWWHFQLNCTIFRKCTFLVKAYWLTVRRRRQS